VVVVEICLMVKGVKHMAMSGRMGREEEVWGLRSRSRSRSIECRYAWVRRGEQNLRAMGEKEHFGRSSNSPQDLPVLTPWRYARA
jgi:hypothetical protein